MFVNNPLPRGGYGVLHEGSPQRSTRDADGIGNAWKTTNKVVPNLSAVQNVISQHTREINRLRRRIPTFIQPPTAAFYPFKIYSIGNASATDVQRAVYTTAGYDISSFTFQIRSGVIGYRSQYFVFAGGSGDEGVFEEPMICPNTDISVNQFDSPPVSNTGLSIVLSNTADTLIWDASVDTILSPIPQIVLDVGFDGTGFSLASFWIQIVDDPDLGIYPKLYGRMFASDNAFGRPSEPLPSTTDSSIIPIGQAAIVVTNLVTTVYQYMSGNLVNRYAALAPLSSPLGPINIQRGYWNADSLSGQVFFLGDVVVDDSAVVVDFAAFGVFYGVYTYSDLGAPVSIVISPPASALSPWTMTGTIYSSTPL